jgi:hypothetical protein
VFFSFLPRMCIRTDCGELLLLWNCGFLSVFQRVGPTLLGAFWFVLLKQFTICAGFVSTVHIVIICCPVVRTWAISWCSYLGELAYFCYRMQNCCYDMLIDHVGISFVLFPARY